MSGIPSDDYADDSIVEPLPEDNQTPFSPAAPVSDEQAGSAHERADEVPKLSSTHQATDTGIQPEEVYESGLASAAGASEPNVSDNVVDYNPDEDQRNDA